jgi:two-component system alkaline phosphatase synthesis response regulator PhoP
MAMKRILAVDDDRSVLYLEEEILRGAGYTVTTAHDGISAISLLNEQEFDLVLLDVMMPGVDGFEVSRTFRQMDGSNKVPVIFITARDDAETMREGFEAGGTLVLTKPFTSKKLLDVVSTVIDR